MATQEDNSAPPAQRQQRNRKIVRGPEQQEEFEGRVAALTWALSSGFEEQWRALTAPHAARGLDVRLTQPRRVLIAMLAWFADATGYAWPTVADLAARTGLSPRAVAYALRWYRALGFGARAKAKRPVRGLIEQIAAECAPTAGRWAFTPAIDAALAEVRYVDAKKRKTGEDHDRRAQGLADLAHYRASTVRINDLSRWLANAGAKVRGAELVDVARKYVDWTTEIVPLHGTNPLGARLKALLDQLVPALAELESGGGVEHRRHGAPTYLSHASPPHGWKVSRGTIYAWVKGLDLDDRSRLVLHAILCWTSGVTWKADGALAASVGVSRSTWKRGLCTLRSRGLVVTATIPKGRRLPSGQVAHVWTTAHRIDWTKLHTAAALDPAAAMTLQIWSSQTADLSQSNCRSDPVDPADLVQEILRSDSPEESREEC